MPKTILIVDDSITVRELISLNLQKIPDLKLVQAADGVEALEKIASEAPAMILSDIRMPNMDGLELLDTIRNKNGDKSTPIIMITTKGEEGVMEKAMALGASSFVTKPINGAALIRTILELLG